MRRCPVSPPPPPPRAQLGIRGALSPCPLAISSHPPQVLFQGNIRNGPRQELLNKFLRSGAQVLQKAPGKLEDYAAVLAQSAFTFAPFGVGRTSFRYASSGAVVQQTPKPHLNATSCVGGARGRRSQPWGRHKVIEAAPIAGKFP